MRGRCRTLLLQEHMHSLHLASPKLRHVLESAPSPRGTGFGRANVCSLFGSNLLDFGIRCCPLLVGNRRSLCILRSRRTHSMRTPPLGFNWKSKFHATLMCPRVETCSGQTRERTHRIGTSFTFTRGNKNTGATGLPSS